MNFVQQCAAGSSPLTSRLLPHPVYRRAKAAVRAWNLRWGRHSRPAREPRSGTPDTTEHRRRRRLGPLEQWIWYLLAAATYIGLGVFHKFLFNWFIGPIWLIAVVVTGPALSDWLRRRARAGE